MLLCAAMAASAGVHACDVCGSAAGGQYLGLLPGVGSNFIGLQYQFNGFKSHHPSLFHNQPDERSTNYYHTLQLWGRYAMGQRVQLFGFVPYRHNLQYGNAARHTLAGIGDVSLLATIVVLGKTGAPWQQQLLLGAGAKAPTGKYIGITETDKLGLPNLQAGTGSWDFQVSANYTVKRGAYGANMDASYAITTANHSNYKYGNKLGISAVAFRALTIGNVEVLPQAGLRYEYALHDYDNYQRKWLNQQSGGHMAFATAGLQAHYRRVGGRLSYHVPVSQHYSSGFVTIKQRADVSLFFIF